MAPLPFSGLSRYDALYLSPHADDAALACAGRLHAERARGERAVVLVLFDSDVAAAAEALAEWGVDVSAVGLTPGARRHAGVPLPIAGLRAIARGRRCAGSRAPHPGRRRSPREGPPGLRAPRGGRPHRPPARPRGGAAGPHRRAGPQPLPVRGAARGLRSRGGARPAGAAGRAAAPGGHRVGRAGLLSRATCCACSRLPPGAATCRAGATGSPPSGAAAGEWRSARAWNPQKAFGPRLQPVVHVADAAAAEAVRQLWSKLRSSEAAPKRGAERWRVTAQAYTRKLGAAEHAERYWLVLPAIHGAEAPTRREELLAGALG